MKTLIFEGAGWEDADSSKATDVGNCRIRTAFTNNNGKTIYLELSSMEVHDKKAIVGYNTYLHDCFEVAYGSNYGRKYRRGTDIGEYSKVNILAWVNANLNCSFDEMQVCNNGKYRVSTGKDSGYNTIAGISVYDKEYEIRQYFINKKIDEILQNEQLLTLVNECKINMESLRKVLAGAIESKDLHWYDLKRDRSNDKSYRNNIIACNAFRSQAEPIILDNLQEVAKNA